MAFAEGQQYRRFESPWGLSNSHAMTILGNLRPRRYPVLAGWRSERLEFQTEPEIRVVAHAHWQAKRARLPVVLIVHGLEGSAEASYVMGTADKALRAGFNVLRVNVRGCGGTAHLSPKIYHTGLTTDIAHIVRELIEREGLSEIYVVGFSMGGNQALKYAGELGAEAPEQLRGVCAISPPIDIESCSISIMEPSNQIYEQRFIRSLRRTIRERERLFPGRYDLSRLGRVRHLWDWDDQFQPYNGFRDAKDYYDRASSISFLPRIAVPTMIIHAEDDPFIPFEPFRDERLRGNGMITLLATRNGGHVAFCGKRQADEDRAWAENRAIEFFGRLVAASGGERRV